MSLILSQNVKVAKMVALAFFLASTALFCYVLGMAVGILASTVVWMILSSLVTLFAPFPRFKYVHLILLTVVLVSVELILKYI
ncbi:MAG: hypothetical protein AAF361_15240 [Bacteroidota bacterium]